jgi:hypothetical protein
VTSTRPRPLQLLLIAVLVAATALFAAPAQAADAIGCRSTCSRADASKDAPAKADILRARFHDGPRSFGLVLRLRDLKRTGTFVVGAGLGGWGVNYRVVKTAKGYRVSSQTISEVQVYPAKPCSTARVAWNAKRNVVRATLPYACTGNSGDPIMNGVDFHAGRATDRIGKVFYRP